MQQQIRKCNKKEFLHRLVDLEISSQAEIARRCGVKPASVSILINAETSMNESLMKRVCGVIGESIDVIFPVVQSIPEGQTTEEDK